MVEDRRRKSSESRSAKRTDTPAQRSSRNDHGSPTAVAERPSYPTTLLNNSVLGARGNSPVQASLIGEMQQTQGNRAVQRFLRSTTSTPTVTSSNVSRDVQRFLQRSARNAPGAPLAVQRCGGEVHEGCACAEGGQEEQSSSAPVQTMRVQRIPSWNDIKQGASNVAGDVAGAVLPAGAIDFFKNARDTVKDKISDAGKWAGDHTSKSQEQLHKSPEQMETETQAAGNEAATKGAQMETGARTDGKETEHKAKDVADKGIKAAGKVAGVGQIAGPLVSPLTPMISPEKAASGAQNAGKIMQGAAGGAAGGPSGELEGAAKKELNPKEFTCDAAGVLADVGGVAKSKITKLVNIVNAATGGRLPAIAAAVDVLTGGMLSKAALIGGAVMKLGPHVKKFYDDKVKPMVEKASKAIGKVKEVYNKVKDAVKTKIDSVKKVFLEKWGKVKEEVGKAINDKIKSVREGISSKIEAARNFLGKLGSAVMKLLPDWAKGLVAQGQKMLSDAVDGIKKKAAALAKLAVKVKDAAVKKVKEWADAKLKKIASNWQKAKEYWEIAKKKAIEYKDKAVALIPEPIKQAAKDVKDWAGRQVARVKGAAGKAVGLVSNAVCDALDEEKLKKCADEHMKMEAKTEKSIKLFSTKEVVIPLEGFNVKVTAGSSITLARVSEKVFTVTIEGEGAGYITTQGSGASEAKANIEIPEIAGKSEVWNKLAGAQPGATSPGGDPGKKNVDPKAAGAPGGGGGASGSAEVGMKGKMTTAYAFTAGSKDCKGLAGMMGLLAAYGVAGGLPEPFSSLASIGINENFRGNMTKQSFEIGREASASGETGGSGLKASGKIGVSQSISIAEQRKQDPNDPDNPLKNPLGTVMSLTLGATLSGTVAADIPEISKLGEISAGMSGEIKLILSRDSLFNINTTSLEAGAKASLVVPTLKDFDTGIFGKLLPAALPRVNEAIKPLKDAGAKGTLEASVGLTVDIGALMSSINTYLSPANKDNITAVGLIEKVQKDMVGKYTTKLEVTFTGTSRLAADVSAKEKGMGGSAAAGAEYTVKRTLYP